MVAGLPHPRTWFASLHMWMDLILRAYFATRNYPKNGDSEQCESAVRPWMERELGGSLVARG